jgi:hypothetical protein
MLVTGEDVPVLALQGSNLATAASIGDFPLATLNDTPVRIVNASAREVRIALQPGLLREGVNELRVALDPYAVITLDVNA